MNEMLQADIFFFITAIAVVILTGVLVGVLIYILSILKDVKYVTKQLREKTDKFLKFFTKSKK